MGKQEKFDKYLRQCKRCDKFYRANSRLSQICEKCNLNNKRWITFRKNLKIKKSL